MDSSDHTSNSRRAFLQLVAAGSAATTLGGVVSADVQDDSEDGGQGEADDGADDVPVSGDFPAGETVGLQQVAGDLPAPTNMTYVEDGDEDRHFLATQTGQIYAFDPMGSDATDGEMTAEPADGEAETGENATDGMDDATNETDGATEVEGDGETGQQQEGALDVDEIVLDGATAGWIGREPEQIADEENPPLQLIAGQTYTLTWENVDGQPHNVVILDEDEEIVERTEIISEEGATQSLEFEATEEMVTYLCEVHPGTMVGDVELTTEGDGADESAGVASPADMDLFLDVGDRLVDLGIGRLGDYDERGLLGLAFHPDFGEQQTFYVRYSAPAESAELVDVPEDFDHVDVLAEFEVTGGDGNGNGAGGNGDGEAEVSADSERRIMEIPQPQDNHNGGQLAFDDDGYLYTSVGDGGNVHDIGTGHVEDWYDENEGGNAQDTQENLLGGIHRIEVTPGGDGDAMDGEEATETDETETPADGGGGEQGAYSVPDDNPLVGTEFRGEYYAWGFRNPWGMSIDDDGTMFVADAGQHRIESAYTVEAGGNYGWNVKEGSFCFSPETPLEPPEECPDQVDEDVADPRGGEELRDPIVEYRHLRISEAFIDSSVVVGGHRYAGDTLSELQDAFVFGNWSSQGVAEADGEILVATAPDGEADDESDDETWTLEELQLANADDQSINRYVYGVERDQQGELYVLANTDYRPFPETGELYRIVPEGEGEEVPAPEDPETVAADAEQDGNGQDGANQNGGNQTNETA